VLPASSQPVERVASGAARQSGEEHCPVFVSARCLTACDQAHPKRAKMAALEISMETSVLILQTFVSEGEGRPERKERFAQGQTIKVSEEDAAEWIAKELAREA
jgi:hypothetical protein